MVYPWSIHGLRSLRGNVGCASVNNLECVPEVHWQDQLKQGPFFGKRLLLVHWYFAAGTGSCQ